MTEESRRRCELEAKAAAKVNEHVSFVHAPLNVSKMELLKAVGDHPLWKTFSGKWGHRHAVLVCNPAQGAPPSSKAHAKPPSGKTMQDYLTHRVAAAAELAVAKDNAILLIYDALREQNRNFIAQKCFCPQLIQPDKFKAMHERRRILCFAENQMVCVERLCRCR